MSLYTERHGMRLPIVKTYEISETAYSILLDCCERYFDNLAWKYPCECEDGYGCCGIDWGKFRDYISYEIPCLQFVDYKLFKPREHSIHNPDIKIEPLAILDLIEYIAQNVHEFERRDFHRFFGHYHLKFSDFGYMTAKKFVSEINNEFDKLGLLYRLTNQGEVERIEEAGVLSQEIEQNISEIKEPGLKELLQIAIKKHKSKYPEDQHDAVEKIWDALERLKTYHIGVNKKESASQIVKEAANGNEKFQEIFEDEFCLLTKIGNQFRIRHHETDKIEIKDGRHLDYFFNRCLSLIATTIQYLQ